MALLIEQASFEYRAGRPVLDGVSHPFRQGAVTGVIGPNGAGKSTLLRLMLGVLMPTRGQVTLDGQAIAPMPIRARARRIAYIPQRTSPAFGFTVAECVRMGRLASGLANGKVERALARTGLSGRAADPFDSLSAGQQQKAVLARALAQLDGAESPVLLADEPASALDPAHLLEAMTILKERAAAGATVVTVLHDFAAAARFCDEVIVISAKGQLAAQGPAASVLMPGVLDSVFGVRFVKGEPTLVATPPAPN